MAKSSIRIKARKKPGLIEVKLLITHPMETGFRYDINNERVPAHYIKEIACYHNDTLVLKSHWGVAVSKDPYLSFRLEGGEVGDTIRVSWWDSEGDNETLEAKVS